MQGPLQRTRFPFTIEHELETFFSSECWICPILEVETMKNIGGVGLKWNASNNLLLKTLRQY
jgi:hypothetical protein